MCPKRTRRLWSPQVQGGRDSPTQQWCQLKVGETGTVRTTWHMLLLAPWWLVQRGGGDEDRRRTPEQDIGQGLSLRMVIIPQDGPGWHGEGPGCRQEPAPQAKTGGAGAGGWPKRAEDMARRQQSVCPLPGLLVTVTLGLHS